MDNLVERFKSGDVAALSRLISMVENDNPLVDEIMLDIETKTKSAQVIGITGPPGAGKSTLVDKLIRVFRKHGKSVGALLVDPSSILSGGAFLGDRIRIDNTCCDDEVYLRSLATRGELGGLTPKIGEIVNLLDAFGKNIIIIETVGIGQMEADIINYADTKVVLAVPGLGDQMQAMKGGILEIADVFVVNKADISGAENVAFDLNMMLQLKHSQEWTPDIVMTQALNNKGIDELYDAIMKHEDYLKASGARELLASRNREFACFNAVMRKFKRILSEQSATDFDIIKVFDEVKAGSKNPHEGAREVLELLLDNRNRLNI